MKAVVECIRHSQSANRTNQIENDEVNLIIWRHRVLSRVSNKNYRLPNPPHEDKASTQQQMEKMLSAAIDENTGNCLEMAALLACLIIANPMLGTTIKQACKISSLNEPDDHTVVLIGSASDPNALILDPWINLVAPPNHLKQEYKLSFAKATREGFLGLQKNYKRLVKAYEGTPYIASGAQHTLTTLPDFQPTRETAITVAQRLQSPITPLYYGEKFRGRLNQAGKPHGPGEMILPSGSRIKGTWIHGKLSGPAEKLSCLSGYYEHYRGEMDSRYRYHGPGVRSVLLDDREISQQGVWNQGQLSQFTPKQSKL